MNPLNYASLEASKRLVDAGIVLETETPINVNIEIVKGCKNTSCICWNKTCKQNGLIKEMSIYFLSGILSKLQEINPSNVALYGLGESLYHRNLLGCITETRKYLPKSKIHLNTDVHVMNTFDDVPPVDYFNICLKKYITPLHRIYVPDNTKVTHIFILEKIDKKILSEIDKYIDVQFSRGYTKHHYMIGSLWDHDFGDSPKTKMVPLEVENGIDIVLPVDGIHRGCEYKRKVYIGIDGSIKKCMFSHIIYKNLDFIRKYDRSECKKCNMGAYKYILEAE